MTRTHPHDQGAEQAVIGAVLLAPDLMPQLTRVLTPHDFYRPAHTLLWTMFTNRHQAGQPIDPVAVAAHLDATGELGRIGGAAYLHTLVAAVPTTANAGHYADIVAGHARRRQVIELGTRLTQLATSANDPGQLLATSRAMLDAAPTVMWPDPIPLGAAQHLPAFPVEVLPAWLGDQVRAVARFTQTPPDLAGCIGLAGLSTAAGGRAAVEVRGSWREPVNLYLVVVMAPGSRKSAVFAAMTSPLLAAERALIERTRPLIVEAELAAKVATRTAEKAAAAAANASAQARDEMLAEASAAAVTADTIAVPALPRLIADDITSEQAASLLAEQGGRLAVLSAEGGIFATLAGRYSGTPNLEVFLKGHAGDMLRVDRRSRPAEHIEAPALTLGLAVQPEVLRDLAQMPGFRGKGLLARILFSLPTNTVGSRTPGAPAVPVEVGEAYSRNLAALIASLADRRDPAALVLTPDADARVLAIEYDVEPKLAPGAQWHHIVDWASKYTGAIVRIAGLLHMADHLQDDWGKPISAETIDRAAQLGSYFAAHALNAFDYMGADPIVDNARVILAFLKRAGTERITKRDLFSGVTRGRFAKTSDLDPALRLLESHGYMRTQELPERSGPGRRPSPAWLVHPQISGVVGKPARHLQVVNA